MVCMNNIEYKTLAQNKISTLNKHNNISIHQYNYKILIGILKIRKVKIVFLFSKKGGFKATFFIAQQCKHANRLF